MAMRRVFEFLLVSALVSGCVGVDPCTDYDMMWMEYGQRSSDFNSENTSTSICDAFIDENTWYRFEHDAGNRLIERPVEPWYCGTQAPIWMNGTHPTNATEVTALVCSTHSTEDYCWWNGTVRIQLCNESGSEFFVYLLDAPRGCPQAYCVDAESRKNCTPPEIWFQDQFKCAVKTTPAPTTTVPPIVGWGPWGPWSNCSKPCDFGTQTRNRTCGQPPCPGEATSHQLCAKSNCEELPEEKDKGIVLSLQSANDAQDTMLVVVSNQQTIDTIMRSNINSICSKNASLCCGFNVESISSDSIEFVTSDDIYPAKGFPKQISDGTVDYKVIAIVDDAVNQATCRSTSLLVKVRKVRSTDSNYIPFEVMEIAARNSAPDILKETGLAVEDYLDPATYTAESQDDDPCPVTTCIVPIVVCCIVIPVIAIIIGCVALKMMNKSKTAPKSGYSKDPNLAAPNMVNPYVNSGQIQFPSLPAKPS